MLRAYLWKEWREQRWNIALSALACLAIGLMTRRLPAAVSMLGSPGKAVPDRILALALAGLATGFVLVAGSLMARERSGRGMEFLARLPGTLGRAILAKVLVWALAALVIATLCAFFTYHWVAWVRVYEPALSGNWSPPAAAGQTALLVFLGFILGLWAMASSTWLRQQGLAVPAAVLLVALWWFPFLCMWFSRKFIFGSLGIHGVHPPEGELLLLVFGVLPLAGLAVLWLAGRAAARTGSARRAGIVYGALLLGATGGSWGWMGLRHDAWLEHCLATSGFEIETAGRSGEPGTCEIHLGGDFGHYSGSVDLEEGSCTLTRGIEGFWWAVVQCDFGSGLWSQDMLPRLPRALTDTGQVDRWSRGRGPGPDPRYRFLGGQTARNLFIREWRRLRRKESRLAGTELVGYIGHGHWMIRTGRGGPLSYQLYVAADGTVRALPWLRGYRESGSPLWCSHRTFEKRLFCPGRTPLHRTERVEVYPSRNKWLFVTQREFPRWVFTVWDRRTGEMSAPLPLPAWSHVYAVDRTRVLVRSYARCAEDGLGPEAGGRMVLFNYETGETRRVRPPVEHLEPIHYSLHYASRSILVDRNWETGKPRNYYFLGPEGEISGPVSLPPPRYGSMPRLIGRPRKRSTLFNNQEAIVEVDFQARTVRTLFPRPVTRTEEASR